MKLIKKLLLAVGGFVLSISNGFTQCPQNNTYSLTVTPPCPGTSTVNCINGGQYVTVNVISGNLYTFSTCGNTAFDTQISVYSGATVIGYNDDFCGVQSTVTWTATFTGTVNVLIDEYNCSNSGLCTTLTTTCSLPVQSGNGCNTNSTICTPGVAGPFAFSTPGYPVSSCLDWIGLSYAYIVLYITQSGPLEMLINGNVTNGFLDVSIFDIPSGVAPCNAILDVNNEISCNYAAVPGGCNEIGTYFGCSSNVPSPMVQAGDVLMIVVENWSNASTTFTLQLAPVPAAQTGPPDAAIIPAGPFCSTSAPFQLTSVIAGGTWSGTGVSATGLFNPASVGPGTYTVTHNLGSAPCASSATSTIIVNPLPIVGAGNNQTICATATAQVTLTGSGATTYSWNNGVTNGSAFAPPSGLATTTTTYTVTGTNSATGCTNTDQVDVIVNPIPIVSAGLDVPICIGGSAILTATGATSYSWAPGGQLTAAITVSPVATTTYTVIGTSLGCSASNVVTVTILPNAPINAGLDVPICLGATTTLSATGGVSYAWDNGLLLGNNFVVSPTVTTDYIVVGTDAAGCVGTDAITVTVNPNPTPVIIGPATYCPGNFALLGTTTPFTTYSWSTGAVTPTINATQVDSPVTVTVTNASGCQTTTLVFLVTENNVITVNSTVTICQGQSSLIHGINETVAGIYSLTTLLATGCDSISNVTLVVNPLPIVNAGLDQVYCGVTNTSLNGSGAATYVWNNGVTNGVSFSPAVGTLTYTVTGTSAAGCFSTDQADITINPLPIVGAGPDQPICAGTPVTLSGSGALVYTWNNGVTDGQVFTPVSTTTYTVTGTSAAGCTSTDQVIVTVNPIPAVYAGIDVTICANQTVTLTGSGAATYTWDNGVTNGQSFPSLIGNTVYTVTGTDANGCVNTDNVSTNVILVPVASILPDVTNGYPGLVVNFINNSTNASSYNWVFGNGGNANLTTLTTQTITYSDPGTYTVLLTASNGICDDVATIQIVIMPFSPPTIQVPNVFTPNHDNANDDFFIDTDLAVSLKLIILNRWGNVVHEITDLTSKWNGEINGKEASEGVYFYKYEVVGINGDVLTGHGNITLIR